MVQVIWTKRAVADLDSIGKYIAIDSEYAAQKFVQELIKGRNAYQLSGEGRPIPEKITGKYRQILHRNYRIIYKLIRRTIIIYSVYYQKKLLFKIDDD